MSAPFDDDARQRFIHEHDRGFSVVASAGSGKTRAIVERIVALAHRADACQRLPRLVVVTFTNRAADEMQQRARASILEAGVSVEVMAAFERAFFGTIHSFCVKLLRNHGMRLGLPAQFDLITDDDEIWRDFVQQQTEIGTSLLPDQRQALLRHVEVWRLMALGRHGGANCAALGEPGACPPPQLEGLLAFAKGKKANPKIEQIQEDLRDWHRALVADDRFLPLLECTTTAREFVQVWQGAFTPLREWIRCCSLRVAAEVEEKYRAFRIARGVLTYDDQVTLALDLLHDAGAARRIREKGYCVILDEAQDTDPAQFSVLLEIARPVEATGDWHTGRCAPPEPGRFCMVGDFQQAIFGGRADLAQYRRTHEALLASGTCEEVRFSVTFRLDETQIAFINHTFHNILGNAEGQVEFIQLHPRPGALPGQVIRFELTPPALPPPAQGKSTDRQRARFEAEQLARWLRITGLEGLRARSWREVAILCPRKRWFQPLDEALRREDFEVQIQSERDIKGDSPAFAWLTALTTIMADPTLGYEIVGVLREVFGLADDDLALFCEGRGDRFQIGHHTAQTGSVAEALNCLTQLRLDVRELPLFSAIEAIICGTQLRERLAILPRERFTGLDEELDALRTSAATAEAEGQLLGDFAETLRADFLARREVRASAGDAIQLITAHKAKGSEWDAVVVPFLSRDIRPMNPRYPRVITRAQGEVMVAFSRDDLSAEVDAELKLRQRQEMERLLYVALTRSRHTLVLASDEALFANNQGKIQSSAQTHLLGAATDGRNTAVLRDLRTAAETCAMTREHQRAIAEKNGERESAPLPSFTAEGLVNARAQAQRFWQKRTPSAAAASSSATRDVGEGAVPELEPAARVPAPDNPATRYGAWWHEFAEQLPWRRGEADRQTAFDREVQLSPDAQRSLDEWELLRAHLRSGTPFAQRLLAPDAVMHTELPFLQALDEKICVEGIIDLAVWDTAAERWFLLDWKTNRVSPGKVSDLKAQYQSQIIAYADALASLTGRPVEAGIYSTALGEWMSCSR